MTGRVVLVAAAAVVAVAALAAWGGAIRGDLPRRWSGRTWRRRIGVGAPLVFFLVILLGRLLK